MKYHCWLSYISGFTLICFTQSLVIQWANFQWSAHNRTLPFDKSFPQIGQKSQNWKILRDCLESATALSMEIEIFQQCQNVLRDIHKKQRIWIGQHAFIIERNVSTVHLPIYRWNANSDFDIFNGHIYMCNVYVYTWHTSNTKWW